ncbi:putative ubiquinol-cytochrome c reductase cytochrome c subunit [Hoyosella rhizosphaerae]|uniref:Cytochrome bc1 complex cytochrome c subunit n=2 Tax=Hoyosella rhizosphaerae TaxID=1755582 RepID=A0A916UFU4_9ACTN|nr:putative ubiquinol-cytochrome c reductase cytochrome c subunit [Hoyosella rhizosphaerae]
MLLMGLAGAGVLATAVTPQGHIATASDDSAALIREGKQLYDTSCITCHGVNLQGVADRGPSLIGVGEASVYFQVASGRMPAMRNEAQAIRKEPKFEARQIDALGAYIQSNGGGPVTPRDADGTVATASLRGNDPARGGELWRQNCASCHNFTGQGGALSSGKWAPELTGVPEPDIYTAMLVGPQNMPKFSDRQLSPEDKRDIIAYVKAVNEPRNPGGYGLGGFGPVSEGMTMWVLGISVVIGATLWIGARS